MERYYIKQYIPGYTGHIQHKLNTFGMTAGAINRQLVLGQKEEVNVPSQRLYYTNSVSHVMSDGDKAKYGYRSRYGISWIAGSTHEVFPQHIPRNLCFNL